MFKLRTIYILFILFFAYSNNVMSLDFKLVDLKQKTHQLADYKGKWLVLNYWATWCPPCRREIPMLVDYNEARDDVQVFGINYEPGIDQQRLKDFVDTYFINYPIIPATKALTVKFGVPSGLPMTIFISPEGKIAKRYTGMLNKSFLDRVMK
ncbi:MAG: TlpA disulfide reductase family protein [Pseudomonadota bacterium]